MTTTSILIGLINEVNSLSRLLREEDITIGPPSQDISTIHNTRLPVTAVPGSGYKGVVDVFYNRVALSDTAIPTGIQSEDVFTSDMIIAQLDRHPAVPLETEDVQSFTAPDLQVGDITTITVTAEDQSLGWIGATDVSLLYGLPPNSDELYDLMNHQLPTM